MEISALIAIILAVLNLILFFKVWGMTNDVSRIADYVQRIANRTSEDSKPKTTIGQETTTSTANPMPSKEEETTLTEDPNKDDDTAMDSGAKFALIALALAVIFFVLLGIGLSY